MTKHSKALRDLTTISCIAVDGKPGLFRAATEDEARHILYILDDGPANTDVDPRVPEDTPRAVDAVTDGEYKRDRWKPIDGTAAGEQALRADLVAAEEATAAYHAATQKQPVSSPEMREVPRTHFEPGDTVTVTALVGPHTSWSRGSHLGVPWDALDSMTEIHLRDLAEPAFITFTRPVSPLPDKRGGGQQPSPEMRRVPTGEAREGDTVMVEGSIVEVHENGFTIRRRSGHTFVMVGLSGPFADLGLTITRPVSPLPDKPGAVGTATVRGVKGVRIMLSTGYNDAGPWFSSREVGFNWWHGAEHIEDYQPLPLLDGEEGN